VSFPLDAALLKSQYTCCRRDYDNMLLRPQTLAYGVEGMLRECDTNCTHETKTSAREEDK